jgi:hypothetical protein
MRMTLENVPGVDAVYKIARVLASPDDDSLSSLDPPKPNVRMHNNAFQMPMIPSDSYMQLRSKLL